MKGNGFVILSGIISGVVMLSIIGGIIFYNYMKDKEIYTPDLTFAEGEDKIMLVDYMRRTVGTNGGDGYRETVLYCTKDGNCEVHYYSKYDYDEAESHEQHEADKGVVEDVYNVIKKADMASWNDKYKDSTNVICGAAYIVKFRDGHGDYIRVSSECMPDDGIELMGGVATVLNRHVMDAMS